VVAAEGNGGKNVFFVARDYDADRDLAVIGAVGCVESAAARVEADLSAKVAAEGSFERGGIELRGMGRRCGDVLRHRLQNIFEDTGVGRKGIASWCGADLPLWPSATPVVEIFSTTEDAGVHRGKRHTRCDYRQDRVR
jgi:hypothetical protein